MTKLELIKKISALLGRFVYTVKAENAAGFFDINTYAEDFLIPVFRIAFGSPDLQNLNCIKMNFPAVDLGCQTSRVSIQVTSDPASPKILKTLEKFEEHDLGKDFDRLYVYVITERQSGYTSEKLKKVIANLPVSFNPGTNILDYKDLLKMIGSLKTDEIQLVANYLDDAFKREDVHLKFRDNLDAFLNISHLKIENEKKTKKYIPSIFVETSKTKDEMRYFSNPMFFYRKIDDEIRRLDLGEFNKLLNMAKVDLVESNLNELCSRPAPNNLVELYERLQNQRDNLESIKDRVAPFTCEGDKSNSFVPEALYQDYWTVFKVNVQHAGYSIHRILRELSKKVEIAKSKIFLVTGMAGQGKTNFICDLVENQFRKFEVPTIFIPARALNDFQSPNRILQYIKNNRFAPTVSDLQELFSLLNSVAEESQKPFIIAIDGINEVGDLEGFVRELRVFLEALYQYDFLKIVLTCRNEFFDFKFADVFEPQFSDYLYRVKDLRNEMSDENKYRIRKAYLQHFGIRAKLSRSAKEFLENDLILLRIFSEINAGKDIGYVSNIYKGDIFEEYLILKLKEFPDDLKPKVLDVLFEICSRMFDSGNFSQMLIDGFSQPENKIIGQLIGEDIILRREVPSTGLEAIGNENISFTYDELRDFLLAYYTVIKIDKSDSAAINSIFEKITEWPIYEGFFRYAYVLARKKGHTFILKVCEGSKDFQKHYLNNLDLLSADIQADEDVERLQKVLRDVENDYEFRKASRFLFLRRDTSEKLSIEILLGHLNSLDDEKAHLFMEAFFSENYSYSFHENVSEFLNGFLKHDEKTKLSIDGAVLAFVIHCVPYAQWNENETTLNFLTKHRLNQNVRDAIEECKKSSSKRVLQYLVEIESGE